MNQFNGLLNPLAKEKDEKHLRLEIDGATIFEANVQPFEVVFIQKFLESIAGRSKRSKLFNKLAPNVENGN